MDNYYFTSTTNTFETLNSQTRPNNLIVQRNSKQPHKKTEDTQLPAAFAAKLRKGNTKHNIWFLTRGHFLFDNNIFRLTADPMNVSHHTCILLQYLHTKVEKFTDILTLWL